MMLPKFHILFGAIFFSFIFFIFKINLLGSLIIFLSSIIIDIDHYLKFVVEKRDFNFRRAYTWNKNSIKRQRKSLSVLHSIEVLAILAIFSFFNKYIFYIFIGFIFHSVLDIVEGIRTKRLSEREFSVFNWLRRKIKNKNLRNI